jgi:hypothetical protein
LATSLAMRWSCWITTPRAIALTGDPRAPLPGRARTGVVAGDWGCRVTISATMRSRSADRHLARRQQTHYVGSCAWCGGLSMQAADMPGRRPRFCSPTGPGKPPTVLVSAEGSRGRGRHQ